jgi:hypothetical protein
MTNLADLIWKNAELLRVAAKKRTLQGLSPGHHAAPSRMCNLT